MQYWKHEREKILVNDNIDKLMTEFFTQVSENVIDKVLTKKNIKQLYSKYCLADKKQEKNS